MSGMLCLFPVLLLLVQPVTRVDEVPNPRWDGGWVTDQAEVIGPDAAERINSQIRRLNGEIGIEIAVVTVQAVADSPREFAVDLFNTWGIGSAQTNNGLLIFLAVQERRLEIVTGTGMEAVLTDSWLEQMQLTEMIPLFRSGLFGSGIEAGLNAIESRLRVVPAESAVAAETPLPEETPEVSGATPSPPRGNADWIAWILGAGSLIGGTWFAKRKFQAFRRRCRSCGIPMLLLDEIADDEHLERGQLKEEGLGSVDYDVYICSQCQESRVVPRRKWFARYSVCPNCGYRTNLRTSTTRVHATTRHGGEVEVEERCSHCRHRSAGIRYTPARSTQRWFADSERPARSRSSFFRSSRRTGGSFGGGRTRGGGSGASW